MESKTLHARSEAEAKRRVFAAIALMTLAALTTIRLSIINFRQVFRGPADDDVATFLARCDRLQPELPTNVRIGYFVASQEAQVRTPLESARLELLQYALAPRQIEEFSDQTLMIFDSRDPAAAPPAADEGNWQLVNDFHDGLKLFRSTRGE